ncbi:MAG: PepSY domain-containing protein [Pseudomonas sp.]
MKKLIALSCAAFLGLGSAAVFADDDITTAEAANLVKEGKIQTLESLEEKALSVKAGQITDRDLEHEYGRYIYKLDVRADDGTDWDIDIDASTGDVLKTEQDD